MYLYQTPFDTLKNLNENNLKLNNELFPKIQDWELRIKSQISYFISKKIDKNKNSDQLDWYLWLKKEIKSSINWTNKKQLPIWYSIHYWTTGILKEVLIKILNCNLFSFHDKKKLLEKIFGKRKIEIMFKDNMKKVDQVINNITSSNILAYIKNQKNKKK